MAFEEVCTANNIGRYLYCGCGNRIKIVFYKASCKSFPEHFGKGNDKARELQRYIESIFIVVKARRMAAGLLSCLPFVIAFQINIKQFTTAKGITACKAYHHSWPNTVICFAGNVALYIKIVRLVKYTIQLHIERITQPCRITRREIKVNIAEQTAGSNLGQRFLVVAITIQRAWPEPHVFQNYRHTHGRSFAVKPYGKPATAYRIGQLLVKLVTHFNIQIAYIPFSSR